jgi:hypothetical protein
VVFPRGLGARQFQVIAVADATALAPQLADAASEGIVDSSDPSHIVARR